ncbi:MAG: penicillin-binding protein activator, partial [Gammaproteobacteria bacterium]|nr:penicillin-binding protein activator [Gammaproteobacteria bacterium]
HPANLSIIPTLLDSSRFEITSPEHIALLLPQEGSFARASAAIRDGFVGAWYHGGTLEDEYHPVISIYNATPSTIHSIYQDALEAGAEFIVGPLDKESVTILADYESLDIPTLALNYADTSFSDPSWKLPEGFYQFGLSPEGEARQVAEKAWLDGHTRAIVIYPHSPWGERVSSAFNQAWQELDGTVIDTRAFAKGGQGIAAAIADLLNVDASKARALKLKRFLKQDLKYEPRRRSDVDFVFMAAFPKQARQIRPQLMFHHASDLPVYATSHIYPGTSNPREDRDLNGVMFADMPWILKPKDTAAELQKQIKTNWPEAVTTYNRLFALGVDAYQLVPYLRRMRGNRYASFSGVTGRLLLDERNLVQRELQWAKFRGGKALPVRDGIPGPNGQ